MSAPQQGREHWVSSAFHVADGAAEAETRAASMVHPAAGGTIGACGAATWSAHIRTLVIHWSGQPVPGLQQAVAPFPDNPRQPDAELWGGSWSFTHTKEAVRIRLAKLAKRRADIVVLQKDDLDERCPSFLIEAKRWTGEDQPSDRHGFTVSTHFPAGSDTDSVVLRAACCGQSDQSRSGPALLVPPAAEADTATGSHDHWRVMPSYSSRVLNLATRAARPPVPRTAATRSGSDSFDSLPYLAQDCCHVEAATVVGSFRVTLHDKQAARNFRAGLLRLVDGILSALRRMLVVLLTVLAHQPRAISFLLVMLGSIRHYGHRGEPDAWLLPDFSLRPKKQWGAACPVT